MSGIHLALLGSTFKGLPAIGAAYEGGFFAGQISTSANGVATHNLVVAPASSGESTSRQWKTSQTSTTGTSSIIDGPANSANMNNSSHPAAQFCEGLTIGGYSDWYMPAKYEFEVCFFNLKPIVSSNFTSYGANNYSVPQRFSDYTTSNPGQTSAVDFRSGNAQAFTATSYWTSTQFDSTSAATQNMGSGEPFDALKDGSLYVRAVRRVPV